MRQPARFTSTTAAAIASLCLAGAACGGARHHLGEYDFADRSLALVVLGNPSPGLITGSFDLRSTDLVDVVKKATSKVATDAEAKRARVRMDSATSGMHLGDSLAKRTLDRASRYLGVRPVTSSANADFLLEVHMREYGLDASKGGEASLYTNAEAVLLDRRSGREIWNVTVTGSDRLTPKMRGGAVGGAVGGAIITAGTLRTMTVADFQQALDQLMSLSSDVVAEELRAALRDVRR
jgi:hypothetical protein